ncbi:MAG: peptide-methionine (S)-S-oxide reductase MsrA [Lachnospiraceae bacterium]|nr:peptide-methionine (S)-S-oxide reductase MsrA [Lachnospiraceae bacterium]
MGKKRKKRQTNNYRKSKAVPAEDFLNDFMDDNFSFIAGYTAGGAPYGVTWEEAGIDSSLAFEEKVRLYDKLIERDLMMQGDTKKTIYLAGGCFWGMQKFLEQFDGIIETTVGYANGDKSNPTYEEVCNDSGHAETVKIIYNDRVLPTEKLLQYFFMAIDPTSINRQGGDTGIQYRTGIYYEDESLIDPITEAYRSEQDKYDEPLAVELRKLQNFFPAEDYHQGYLDKNPGGYCHISPQLMKIGGKEYKRE